MLRNRTPPNRSENDCFLPIGSNTAANRAVRVLSEIGIRARVKKAESGGKSGGCSYGVSYPCLYGAAVKTALTNAGL